MTRPELLRRIRKCLALASAADANEHVAAIALAKARELMEVHGVDELEIELLEVEEALARGRRTRKPALWEASLVAAVRRAIGCHAHGDGRGDWVFVGAGPSAEIAAYAFQVLRRQLERARAAYISTHLRRCKPGRKRIRADHFCEGWANAVFHKISALRPKQQLPETVGRYLAERHPGLVTIDAREAKTTRRSDHDDFYRGHERGRQVDLNAGLAGGSAPVRLTAGIGL